ncbi:hypothetical protein RN001_000954 [Aquatica leii]|uniref:DUF4806 domain-containing protein n=1 Tax=Aquatica leii TaxID=1421715 RepID=A0AAN7SQQ6_9COLE|nr:hypothetical protein RN001_000954 [Aquatica leii]
MQTTQCSCSGELAHIKEELRAITLQMTTFNKEFLFLKRFIESFVMATKREFEVLKKILKELPLTAATGSTTTSNMSKREELKEVVDLLPLTTLEDLKSFEQFLIEENNSKLFEAVISQIGGKNGDDHIANAIKYCFHLSLQNKCNRSGMNGKEPLKSATTIKLIINSICTSQYSITQAQSRIKYLLQHTYDRMKSEQKKNDANYTILEEC